MKSHDAVAAAIQLLKKLRAGEITEPVFSAGISELSGKSGEEARKLTKRAEALLAMGDKGKARAEEKKPSPGSASANSVGGPQSPVESLKPTLLAEGQTPFSDVAVVVPDESGVLPFSGKPGKSYVVVEVPVGYKLSVPPAALMGDGSLRATFSIIGRFVPQAPAPVGEPATALPPEVKPGVPPQVDLTIHKPEPEPEVRDAPAPARKRLKGAKPA